MKTFPCPCCTRLGLKSYTDGDTVDVGDEKHSMMMQISPDIPCGCCEGAGIIEVGNKTHFWIKAHAVYRFIDKTFTQDAIESLSEAKFKNFWSQIQDSMKILEKTWLGSPN